MEFFTNYTEANWVNLSHQEMSDEIDSAIETVWYLAHEGADKSQIKQMQQEIVYAVSISPDPIKRKYEGVVHDFS